MMASSSDTCKEIFSLLSRYLDLDLPAEDCDHVRRHLAGCRPCVEFVNSLRKTIELCHAYEPGPLPAPIATAARAELEDAWRQMLAARRRGPKAGNP